jgi:hypothetical protein
MPEQDAGRNPTSKKNKPARLKDEGISITPNLDNLPGEIDLSDLKAALDALPSVDAKIQALAQALSLTTRPDLELEHARIQQSGEFFFELHAAIEQLQISLGPLQENLDELRRTLLHLTSNELRRTRRSSAFPRNDVLAAFDRLHESFIEQVAPLAALPHNILSYLTQSATQLEVLEQSRDLTQLRDAVDTLQQLRAAFMPAINNLEVQLGAFPSFCGHVQSVAGYLSDSVDIQYAQAPSESYGRSISPEHRQSLRFLPVRQNIPLYQDNPFLSSYLHDIVLALQAAHKYAGTPPKFLKSPHFVEFAHYLRVMPLTERVTDRNDPTFSRDCGGLS